MVTETGPELAPVGATTVNDVAEAVVTVAATPAKVTVLPPTVGLKLVPVKVTEVPAGPEVGLMDARVGTRLLTDRWATLLVATATLLVALARNWAPSSARTVAKL